MTDASLYSNEKYCFTGETKDWFGVTLHRIRAVADIAALGITIGTLGGWIEKPENLQVSGDAWVSGNARVYGNARVSGNALVSPVTITGLTWTVTIADQEMVIGCQHHEISAWLAFSDREIIAMDRQALKFWRAYKPVIEAICTDTGRPFAKVDAPAECAAQ